MIEQTDRDEGVMATPDGTLPVTEALIDRVYEVVEAGLPDHVIERAKHVVLDWMTSTCAARETKEVQAIRVALLPFASLGTSAVVGGDETADIFTAAIINGTAAHMLEIDDTLAPMHGHPSGIVAAILALAAHEGMTGREALAAIAAGYEAAVYLGLTLGGTMHHAGFEGTGIVGTVAVTVACGILLGLSRADVESAIGIVTSTQAAGLRSVTGTSAKSLLAGSGGQRGLIAALMARSGFGGPARSIEHPFGLAAAVSDHTTSWVTLPELDDRYGIERTVFKYFSACHALHSSIESAESLKEAGRPFEPDEIASVTIALAPRVLEIANVPEPTTTLQARFSARHIVSAYLTGLPADGSPTGPEGLASPELATLRRRVEVIGDESLEVPDPFTKLDLLSHLEVVKADGAVLRASVPARSVAAPDELPDQWERLARKAEEFAPASLGDGWAGAVVDAVAGLDNADGVQAVTELLR